MSVQIGPGCGGKIENGYCENECGYTEDYIGDD